MTAQALRIVVPGRPPNVANLRGHWSKRARLLARRKALVKVLARSALASARAGVATKPQRVEVTAYLSGVPRDADNLVAGLKADLDGLVQAGVLVDDSPAWCQLHVEAITVAHRAQERVEFEVNPWEVRK